MVGDCVLYLRQSKVLNAPSLLLLTLTFPLLAQLMSQQCMKSSRLLQGWPEQRAPMADATLLQENQLDCCLVGRKGCTQCCTQDAEGRFSSLH
jgi:hypothetical protein